MKEHDLKNKVITASRWSSLTEIATKLVTPFTTMILARIISPEAFGVVATVTMIISFADMFSTAGFQKYIVQQEFKDDNEKLKNANAAFWTNLTISFILFGIIFLFRNEIATLVGNPGLGNVLVVACLQLPITALASVQMALYQRDFDFKTLFLVRIISMFIPVIVTIPLAFLGFSYWSIIIGTLFMQISNGLILTLKSKWKPSFFYDISILKEMFSFSVWSLIEAVSIWLTVWIDTFIIASVLSEYYLGLYKTSTTMVNVIMSIITASIVPVLFSTLSRLQNDNEQFNKTFFQMQLIVSILVFPVGVGVYLYSDLATHILLGSQWSQASNVVGIWALTSSIVIVLGHFCSEVYRAKGRPKLSFLAQFLHLIVLVPTCILSSKFGFWTLVYARSWIRLEGTLVHFILMKFAINFPIMKMLTNVFPTAISALAMGLFGYLLKQLNDGVIWSLASILFCIIFYFGFLCLFPKIRKEMFWLGKSLGILK